MTNVVIRLTSADRPNAAPVAAAQPRRRSHGPLYGMLDDRELVARAARGDAESFRTLVQQYQRLVAHIVFRMIRDQADGEDVCQEVFVRVYRSLAGFRHASKLSTWIARIAYRTCLNHLEKNSLDYDDAADPGVAISESPSLSPADEAEAREMRAYVRERVRQLPLPYRTALTLFYLEDMSVQEVSTVMEVPPNTVKSHLFRGRTLLKQELLKRYAAEELKP